MGYEEWAETWVSLGCFGYGVRVAGGYIQGLKLRPWERLGYLVLIFFFIIHTRWDLLYDYGESVDELAAMRGALTRREDNAKSMRGRRQGRDSGTDANADFAFAAAAATTALQG